MSTTPIHPQPTRYWVIGGRRLEAALGQRGWAEVFGPYSGRAEAEALRRRMDGIYANNPEVRFRIVQEADRDA